EAALTTVGHPMVPPPLIAKRAVIPHGLVRGPGEWATKSRRDGPWRDYEQQVTGYPAGMEYDVPRDGGPPVAFDGFE
ncbi:restriction endonuclease fold toxin 5 domain-containing protein, partial [Klebsiella pneumoniae]|nr:restriction endonuclease fold toxin 5 domain-containing protein [Klebsiella pneumoniae]